MPRAYRQLTLDERRTIRLLGAKVPIDRIARELGRHRSTVHREIGRNLFREVVRGPWTHMAFSNVIVGPWPGSTPSPLAPRGWRDEDEQMIYAVDMNDGPGWEPDDEDSAEAIREMLARPDLFPILDHDE